MSVEVDAKQGPDIKQILDDMRKRYETTIANNRAEAEQAFQQQVGFCQKFDTISKVRHCENNVLVVVIITSCYFSHVCYI